MPEAAAAAADMAIKVAPHSAALKTSTWTTQRQTASLWRAGSDGKHVSFFIFLLGMTLFRGDINC